MKEKRIGKIYEGRWEVIGYEYYSETKKNKKFILKNIFNDSTITLKDQTIRKVERNETTLSKILHNKIMSIKKYKKRRNYENNNDKH